MSSPAEKLAEVQAQLQRLELENAQLRLQQAQSENQQLKAEASAKKTVQTSEKKQHTETTKVLDTEKKNGAEDKNLMRGTMIAELTTSYVNKRPRDQQAIALTAVRQEVDRYLKNPNLYTFGGGSGLTTLVYQTATRLDAVFNPQPPVVQPAAVPYTDRQLARIAKRTK